MEVVKKMAVKRLVKLRFKLEFASAGKAFCRCFWKHVTVSTLRSSVIVNTTILIIFFYNISLFILLAQPYSPNSNGLIKSLFVLLVKWIVPLWIEWSANSFIFIFFIFFWNVLILLLRRYRRMSEESVLGRCYLYQHPWFLQMQLPSWLHGNREKMRG